MEALSRYRRVTVFGGSGFIGRHIVKRLANAGCVVRVAVRDPEAASFLKPMGNVGQVVPVAADLNDPRLVAAAVHGSDAVINLVGILYESGRQGFDAIHAEGARRIAAAAKEAGVARLIHMSALGAGRDSVSHYARSKAAGEEAVRAAYPEATIMRPSVVFGPEDDFFNRFAMLARLLPALPVFGAEPHCACGIPPKIDLWGRGGTHMQPVYVGDVADAFIQALADPGTKGRIYELGGPRVYSFKQLMELVLAETRRKRMLVPVPLWVAAIKATFLGLLPKPPLTLDQVWLLRQDNVVSPNASGLVELGIEATAAEAILPLYLDRYRVKGRFAA